jgi:UDP-2,3-diacylglucosamine pyrophosphatase LpxH
MGAGHVLVISDIHLGEDLYNEHSSGLADYVHALNRELADFIAAHRSRVAPAGGWHLVIDGDMFDFVKLARVVPRPKRRPRLRRRRRRAPEVASAPVTALDPRDDIRARLARIIKVHETVFREMATFLLAGHRITVIEGNHDAECYLREVRADLREAVLRFAHAHQAVLGQQPIAAELLHERFAFRTWFEAGTVGDGVRFHIEHGHQYDEFCSFEYNLAPYDDTSRREVAMPLAHRAIPYFTELLRSFAAEPVESFDGKAALRFMQMLGPRKAWVLFKVYCIAMLELLRRAGKKRRSKLSGLADEHGAELRALAASSPYDMPTLERMDSLKALPAEYSVIKMVRVFWFDVVLATGVAIAGTLISLLIGGAVGLVFAVAVLSGCIYVVRRGNRDRRLDVVRVLQRAAARLAAETKARYVIFGHSHRAELVRVGADAFYLNSGSWVTREVLRGEQGSGMTFIEITPDAAELKRWTGIDKIPRVLASTAAGVDFSVPAHERRKRARGERPARVAMLRMRLEARRQRKAQKRAEKRSRRDVRRND